MPKFAVMLRYEVVSGLVVEAETPEEADRIATEFEAAFHDAIDDTDGLAVEVRVWGNGTVDTEQVDDDDDAAALLDEWLDDIDFGDEDDDFDDEDDDEDDD